MPGLPTFYQPLLALPTELLAEVARHVPDRHELYGYIVDARTLAALSASSRTLRSVVQEMLFREVLITSERQLKALAMNSKRLLSHVRDLNIFMDVEFYDAWQSWAFMNTLQRTELLAQEPPPISPYALLAYVLSLTNSLEVLRIRNAESHGPRSSWNKFARSRAIATPFGVGFENAFEIEGHLSMKLNITDIRLSKLKRIELDGFDDVEPLLALTPNLEVLRLSLSTGFPQGATLDLIEALTRTPKLRELMFTPEALHVPGLDPTGTEVDPNSTKPPNIIDVIGGRLLNLETLDLRAYWHGDDVQFVQSLEYLSRDDLLASLRHLPNVHTLALPTSVMTEDELITLRLPMHATSENTVSRILLWRTRAIKSVEKAERGLIHDLVNVMRSIRVLSFVRPLSASESSDACITYELAMTPSNTTDTSMHSIIQNEFTVPAFLSPGSIPAWPYAPPVSLSYTLTRLWTTSSPEARRHLALTYAHDHEVLALIAAGAGGAVIGHIAHKYGEKVIVAGLFAGSAVYAGSRLLRGRLLS